MFFIKLLSCTDSELINQTSPVNAFLFLIMPQNAVQLSLFIFQAHLKYLYKYDLESSVNCQSDSVNILKYIQINIHHTWKKEKRLLFQTALEKLRF